jgi:hypothetical protein
MGEHRWPGQGGDGRTAQDHPGGDPAAVLLGLRLSAVLQRALETYRRELGNHATQDEAAGCVVNERGLEIAVLLARRLERRLERRAASSPGTGSPSSTPGDR